MQKEEVVSSYTLGVVSGLACSLSSQYNHCLCSSRNYTVPDPPGLFDGHVWPMYLKHKNIMEASGVDVCESFLFLFLNCMSFIQEMSIDLVFCVLLQCSWMEQSQKSSFSTLSTATSWTTSRSLFKKERWAMIIVHLCIILSSKCAFLVPN